ncbi:MAG: hypothetical protein LBR07_09140, partial [Puniceicoccales bacterium]|nr:hypothetical protein [Puniceicoccales bacterium]
MLAKTPETAPKRYAAVDLGAESGRVIVGTLDAGRLALEEFHRFPTGGAFDADGSYRWNINRILSEIFAGLRKVAA